MMDEHSDMALIEIAALVGFTPQILRMQFRSRYGITFTGNRLRWFRYDAYIWASAQMYASFFIRDLQTKLATLLLIIVTELLT